jgi:signal transduction histidine kinase
MNRRSQRNRCEDTGCAGQQGFGFLVYGVIVTSIDALVPGSGRNTTAPSARTLLVIGLGGLAAVAMSIVLGATTDHVGQAALFVWIMAAYIASGLVAWHRRPRSNFGRLLIAVGFGVGLSNLSWSGNPLAFTVGQAADLLPVALFLHVFLAFPTGRLTTRATRIVVGGAYAVSVGLQVVVMLLGGFGPDNLLAVTDAPSAANAIHAVELVTLAALLLSGVALLSYGKRVFLLVNSFALGLVSLALLLVMGVFAGTGFPVVQRLTLAILGLAPIAFLVGLLNARLARTAVGDLVVKLREEPADLRPALARALRDPDVALLYWLPQYQSWVDQEGAAAVPDERRTTRVIRRDGEPIAALVHHPALADEPELLDAVVAATAMVLDNGRLRAELRASLAEVRGSRARVLEVGRRERRRLERDLHDGAQQRLVGLSLRLGLLEAQLAGEAHEEKSEKSGEAFGEALGEALAEAKQEVAASLAELRDIAHGLYPAVLTGHGLAVALESVAGQASVPVRLEVRLGERPPEAVEVAAYYVVCESLTNVDRHAKASGVSVAVLPAGGSVVVEVADDGVGGADTANGSGLRGLADRVEALGGTLRVWSPSGGGTRIRAELPCG